MVSVRLALVRTIGLPFLMLRSDPTLVNRWRWLAHHLKHGPQRTLDAGCGAGEFAIASAVWANNVIGISYNEHLNQICRRRARWFGLQNVAFINADLRLLGETTKEWDRFDAVLCLETLEHIAEDAKLIANLSSLLRTGGKLIVTTPFKHYIPLHGDRISDQEDGGHVRWGYTFEEMKQLFEQAGIRVETETFLNGFVTQKLINLVRVADRLGSRTAWLITLPLRIFQVFDPVVTHFLHYPHFTIAVTGTKLA